MGGKGVSKGPDLFAIKLFHAVKQNKCIIFYKGFVFSMMNFFMLRLAHRIC